MTEAGRVKGKRQTRHSRSSFAILSFLNILRKLTYMMSFKKPTAKKKKKPTANTLKTSGLTKTNKRPFQLKQSKQSRLRDLRGSRKCLGGHLRTGLLQYIVPALFFLFESHNLWLQDRIHTSETRAQPHQMWKWHSTRFISWTPLSNTVNSGTSSYENAFNQWNSLKRHLWRNSCLQALIKLPNTEFYCRQICFHIFNVWFSLYLFGSF